MLALAGGGVEVLCGAGAVCRYLALASAAPLDATSLAADQWCEWEATKLAPLVGEVRSCASRATWQCEATCIYIITPSSSATPRAITELRETLLAPPSRRRPSRRCGLAAALSRRPPLGLAPPSDSARRGGRSSRRAASRSHSPRRGRRPRPRCSSERHARDDGASDRYSGVVSCERRRVRARTLCPFFFFEGRVRILREGARSIVAPGPRANAPSSVSRVECESRGKAPDHDRCATPVISRPDES